MRYFEALSRDLVANGYPIVPVRPRSKHPTIISSWRDQSWHPADTKILEDWRRNYPDHGIGLACGRDVVAIDIDAEDAATVAQIHELCRSLLGDTPLIRQGRAPRIALIYRAAEPIISRRLGVLDTIGLGAQLVAYGKHPRSRSAYRWLTTATPANTPLADLPAISNAAIEALYRQVAITVLGKSMLRDRLVLDPVNNTPPLSSITVLLHLLLVRTLFGEARARASAKHILDTKYGDTGTGFCIELVDPDKQLDP